ncbi:hypothetical protein DFQ03_2737 [Maribacter caenipelagi]|uniref:Uncharacterized protein n=1 Tax=Maribacter caenipelagi TaxID=1447781 RepID=A0A4R7D1M9_9FLAO|nr:hypothetical protein [Maribacter caenipelagi]TDS13445.1 hypothetical protein DFQ03_2737 [Maribacter caenipelagi]
MSSFIKNIVLFCIVGLFFGEVICRLAYVTSDIPSRIIDSNSIQKYNPNQKGHWTGGTHTWIINEDGWPGHLPKSKENLITIIGDSYIENFMNPDSCHQSNFLDKFSPSFNYYEASRSGISFIGAMEIAASLDSLNPIHQLIYVHDADFTESSSIIHKMGDITQFNSKTNSIIPGKLNSPLVKKFLYNWKFIYYLYINYSFTKKENTTTKPEVQVSDKPKLTEEQITELTKLLTYSKNNYDHKNITLVFRPNADPKIITILKDLNFNMLLLKDNKQKEWSFKHDPHWTCIGHEEAAKQISNYILNSK